MLASFLLSVLVFFGRGFDVVHAPQSAGHFRLYRDSLQGTWQRFVYDHHDSVPEMYQARFSGGGNPAVYRVLVWLEKLSCV